MTLAYADGGRRSRPFGLRPRPELKPVNRFAWSQCELDAELPRPFPSPTPAGSACGRSWRR